MGIFGKTRPAAQPPLLTLITPAHLCCSREWEGSTNRVHLVFHSSTLPPSKIKTLFPDRVFEWGVSINAPYPPPSLAAGNGLPLTASITSDHGLIQPYGLGVAGGVTRTNTASAPLTRLRKGIWAASFILRLPKREEAGVVIVARVAYSNLILAELTVTLGAGDMGAEKGIESTGRAFTRVFVSYARSELWVVELVNSVLSALQLADLRWDLNFLKAGDDWEERVREEILGADSFQLFWSQAAKESREVRKEWELALQRQLPGFVRPVYWQDPLAKPPAPLKHLHFAKILLPAKIA